MEDEDCLEETYAKLQDRSQAFVLSLDPTKYTQNSKK